MAGWVIELGAVAMQVEVVLENSLFSADVVVRTAQRFTGDFFVDIEGNANAYVVRLSPRTDSLDISNVEGVFKNEALDECLRERVRGETRELQVALVQAALKGALPPGGD